MRIVAIGAAAHVQILVVARQTQLGLVAFVAARSHQRMAGDAFLYTRRGREKKVQVALLGGEFAQRPNGNDVTQFRRLLTTSAAPWVCGPVL